MGILEIWGGGGGGGGQFRGGRKGFAQCVDRHSTDHGYTLSSPFEATSRS